ncbi:PP2C family protein-serine/threonine phosphatase [Massilia soli]|uniref:Protein phosphatase n=1 Tax=Massilia soli TaxID=2792854 RepID=A0ABS7SMS2_9BURK|nr:protein phosphatase [Massilia soli]MBZ2207472.1 protein phosphatase [Massilia soli]
MTIAPDSLDFGPRFDVAAHSSIGEGTRPRSENQDNYLLIDVNGEARYLDKQQLAAQQVSGWPQGHARVAVLDGMGGHGHGREAAEAAVAGMLAMPACVSLDELSARLDALHGFLQGVFGADSDLERRPGTTLTLLELPPGGPALLFHVGDSRLYKVAAGKAQPLTVDHVPATAFAMSGLIGAPEWWQQVHGEHRSQISQAFILGNAFASPVRLEDPLFPLSAHELPVFLRHLADRRAIELDPGADYLLATDGFWSCSRAAGWVARWPQVLAAGKSAAEACAGMFTEMRVNPPPELHSDNLTAVLVRVRPAAGTDETALPAS